MLDLANSGAKWKKFSIKQNGGLSGFQYCAAIQIAENAILILKGNGTNDSYKYYPEDEKIVKGGKVPESCQFYNQGLVCMDKKIYTLTYYGNVMSYSIAKSKWNIRARYQDNE